jgi:uncharacterized protein (DUF1015 family)
MIVKPFKGLRPPKEFVEDIASRPYDVLSSEEARAEAAGNEKSLYHIIKPEIDFPAGTDEHDSRVYDKAAENFRKFQDKGWLVQDSKEMYYLYEQIHPTMFCQFGLVLCVSVDDYMQGKIKTHELTRRDKEEDRTKHVRVTNANIEPVFLVYRASFSMEDRVEDIIKNYYGKTPEYNFRSLPDGVEHTFWRIDDDKDIAAITALFAEIPAMYIADGHHRTAAAARVGNEKARQNLHHTGDEEYNYFMAVCFPAGQLTPLLAYNRLIKDLNGMSYDEFLTRLSKYFYIEQKRKRGRPARRYNFSLYLPRHWYSLTPRPRTYNNNDLIGAMDVSIASRLILNKILGIKDLRTDKRIDFVGGNQGLDDLQRLVDSGKWRAALALYPVTIAQMMKIADTGNIMPPKTTWFEPKLRSGLVIHKLA